MTAFPREVADAFEPLLKSRRLRWDSSLQDDAAFGNSVVTLQGSTFLLRVSRDRGDVYADLAGMTDPGKWHLLQSVLAAIDHLQVWDDRAWTLTQITAKIESYLDKIEVALDESHLPQTRRAIEEAAAIWMREHFPDGPMR